MKKHFKYLFSVSLLCVAIACSQKHQERSVAVLEEIKEDESLSGEVIAPLSSIAAMERNNSSGRKFIRTADMRFKVKDVIRSTYRIEDITVRHGGFVTNSSIDSQIYSSQITDISEDSSLIITKYTIYGQLTLRVPNVALDTVLKDIAPLVEYLDYRRIRADDVAIQMISNDLTQQRLSKNQQRLENAIDNRGRKLNETTSAEALLLNAQERADNARISNMKLDDEVNFSTISIYVYQRESTKKEIIEKEKEYQSFQPNLASRIRDAFFGGWDMICYLIVGLSYIWGFIVAAILIFIGIRLRKKRKQQSDN